jgi:hypothetical protein
MNKKDKIKEAEVNSLAFRIKESYTISQALENTAYLLSKLDLIFDTPAARTQ